MAASRWRRRAGASRGSRRAGRAAAASAASGVDAARSAPSRWRGDRSGRARVLLAQPAVGRPARGAGRRAAAVPAPAARRRRRDAGAAAPPTPAQAAEARAGGRRAAGRAGSRGAGDRAAPTRSRRSTASARVRRHPRGASTSSTRGCGEDERRDAALAPARAAEATAVRFRDDGFVIRSPRRPLPAAPAPAAADLYTGVLARRAERGRRRPPDQSRFSLAARRGDPRGARGQPDLRVPPAGRRRRVADDQGRLRAVAPHAQHRPARRAVQGPLRAAEPAPGAASSSSSTSRRRRPRSRPGRDIGLMVVGRPLAGRLQYQLAVDERRRRGQACANDNVDLAYAARIVAAPFGPLPPAEGDIEGTAPARVDWAWPATTTWSRPTSVARTAIRPRTSIIDDDGRVDNVAVWQGGVELRALWRGAALQAEWFGRLEDAGRRASPSRQLLGRLRAGELLRHPHRLQVARPGRAHRPPPLRRHAGRSARGCGDARRRAEPRRQRLPARPPGQAPGRLQPPDAADARPGWTGAPDRPPGARRRSAGFYRSPVV